jgi:hypothetical protein
LRKIEVLINRKEADGVKMRFIEDDFGGGL